MVTFICEIRVFNIIFLNNFRAFKIIETFGDKKTHQLRIIPEAWEKNGVLYWPNTEADNLVIQINSTPEENWFQIPCVLKKSKLTSLKIAREKMNNMSQSDDIDELELIVPNVKKAKTRLSERNEGTNSKHANGENLAQSCSVIVFTYIIVNFTVSF